MDEVGGALVAIALVLCAVFIPSAFTGLQGAFYKQFAITIASATLISAFVSLTLSPALAAILLKPHTGEPREAGFLHRRAAALVRRRLQPGVRLAQCRLWPAKLIRLGAVVLIVYAALIYFAVDLLNRTPTGLIPQLDHGYLIAAFQLPPGASLCSPSCKRPVW
jgi:multidrug efflux pump subunit AcrB